MSGRWRQGQLQPDGVWDVTAKGPTFDGRDLFRAFFDVGRSRIIGKARPADLKAEVTTLSASTILHAPREDQLQKRGDKLVALDGRGSFEGGKLFGPAQADAGSAAPPAGRNLPTPARSSSSWFYPNAVGGEMKLEVNLDGQGAATVPARCGRTISIVLGDPVVNELFQATDGSASNSGGGRKTVVGAREKFEFERMRVPVFRSRMGNSSYIRRPNCSHFRPWPGTAR